MSLAVIVIVAGRAGHLARTLGATRPQLGADDELIVVEMDPARPVDAPGTTVVRLGTEVSDGLPLARARNAGARAAGAHASLLFLDVDCLPADGAIDAYRHAIDEHPTALVCGPTHYLREGWDRAPFSVKELADRSDDPGSRPFPVVGEPAVAVVPELFWSLAFGCRAAVWDHVGGFDETYVGYGAEDTDFARRAARRGVPILLVAAGTVYHQWHPPSRFEPSQLDGMIRNAHTFRARWGDWPMTGWFRELASLDLVTFDPDGPMLERR